MGKRLIAEPSCVCNNKTDDLLLMFFPLRVNPPL